MEVLDFDKKRNRVKHCPCGKANKDGKFVPYIGFEDKGYCHSCCEVFLPEQDNKANQHFEKFIPPPPKPVSFIDPKIMESTLKKYEENNFVIFLESIFGKIKAMEAVEAYKIGTSKNWNGANIFWQIDGRHRIRSGKIMLYDSNSGKRQSKNSWAHTVLKMEGFNLSQCLFGEHLLGDQLKPIGIVESEKTAIISSLLLPRFIWLASGGKEGIKLGKFQCLKDRKVYLFPDLTKLGDKANCFDLWSDEAKKLSKEIPGTTFLVSDYLERNANFEDKKEGLDIADYLLKWQLEYKNEQNERNERSEPLQQPFISFNDYIKSIQLTNGILINGNGYPASWDDLKQVDHIENRTKEFIRMAVKNPALYKVKNYLLQSIYNQLFNTNQK